MLTVIEVNGSAAAVGTPTVLPSGATLTMASDGGFNYLPGPDFTGADSFDYTISDGNGGTDTATV